jgi:hypothetical protein
VGIVALEAGVGGELTAVFGHMVANVYLREIGWACFEPAMAKLTQFPAAAHRHLGQNLSLLEVDVESDWTVAQLALYGDVRTCGVIGELNVVAHRARAVATMTDWFVSVLGYGGPPVAAVLAPGFRDEERSSEDHGHQHREKQDGCPKNVLGVGERALRVHRADPP